MLLASWEVRKMRPEVAVSHYTGLTLSRQITYLFFSPLSKISFLILCLPPHKHARFANAVN